MVAFSNEPLKQFQKAGSAMPVESTGAVRLVASGFAAVGLMLVKIGVRGPMVVFGSRQNSHKERTP